MKIIDCGEQNSVVWLVIMVDWLWIDDCVVLV